MFFFLVNATKLSLSLSLSPTVVEVGVRPQTSSTRRRAVTTYRLEIDDCMVIYSCRAGAPTAVFFFLALIAGGWGSSGRDASRSALLIAC